MVFKKPYAFFIKYFRLINLLLMLLMSFLGYRLNLMHQVINDIYMGSLTNYSNLNSSYVGFGMYLLLFLISLVILIIIVTLRRKSKPFRDYLFNLIYNLFLLAYYLAITNLFFTLNDTIVEQTSLKLYSDISMIIIIPLLYFVVKYILIVIGFDLKKFNFAKDIVELKHDEKDNEEVEIIFDKHIYKIKRWCRKYFRELKYYILENKLFIVIISSVSLLIFMIIIFNNVVFNSNKVNINESFNAGNISYKITDVFETIYDYNNIIIDNDNKYIIMNINVRNNNYSGGELNFKSLRLFYGDEYVYANNFYNKYFYDLGRPYNNEYLNSGEDYNYIFIFKIPNKYKSNKYILKIYDGLSTVNNEVVGNYKELKFRTLKLDDNREEKSVNYKEKVIFNKKRYGQSSLVITNYSIDNSFVYNNGQKSVVIRDKDINKVVLILDYNLYIDDNYAIHKYFTNDELFFNNFSGVEYSYNGKTKKNNDVKILGLVDNKVLLSVPYEMKNADTIKYVLNFRDIKITYILK